MSEQVEETLEVPPLSDKTEDSNQDDNGKVLSAMSKENVRLKAALKSQQDSAAAYKAEQERLAMTETERRDADLAAARSNEAALQAQLEAARSANTQLQLTTDAVSGHGLRSRKFGATVLEGFDPELHDFNTFMQERKADPEYAPFFGGSFNRKEAPASPSQGDVRGGNGLLAARKAEAAALWPGNQAAQEHYVNMRQE